MARLVPIALAVALVTGASGLVGCGDDQPEPVPAQPVAVDVTVADGEVQGGRERVEIPRRAEVTLTVDSDVEDLVHVHGYDLEEPVGPDQPATITFEALIPGVFEVELEDRTLPLVELEVQG